MNFTFGIITYNKSVFLDHAIQSIVQQDIPDYEIIVIGSNKASEGRVSYIPFDESIREGWLTRKKNIITDKAKYENIVYMHDYLALDRSWYSGFCTFGNNFKICMNPIKNIDGTRYRDWTLFPEFLPDPLKHRRDLLLPYDVTNLSHFQYISGAYWVAKKEVMTDTPLNDKLAWKEGEDVEWSRRANRKYEFSINILSVVHIMKGGKDRVFSEAQPDLISELNRLCK